MEQQNLEELQEELIHKETIVLTLHAALGGFSLTCLLVLITIQTDSLLVPAASSFFTISAISFLLIALSKYHVLHQAKDIHIGHVIVSEDSAKHPQAIGIACFVIGFLIMLLYISVFTFAAGIFALVAASKHHHSFRAEMNKLMGAREAIECNENA